MARASWVPGGAEFEGLIAMVTGGASGIGWATAQELRRRGASVVVLDRYISDVDDSIVSLEVDIRDDHVVRSSVSRVEEMFGGLDILINNAGVSSQGSVADASDEEWQGVLDVNLVGAARVSRACLPALKRSDAASIVNTCSAAAVVGVAERALYSASKGGLLSLTLAMAADHLEDGIRVNAVNPGTAETPWIQRLLETTTDPHEARRKLEARQPLGRLIYPEEVADAIINLASPRARSTTGSVATVDGGLRTLRIPSQ